MRLIAKLLVVFLLAHSYPASAGFAFAANEAPANISTQVLVRDARHSTHGSLSQKTHVGSKCLDHCQAVAAGDPLVLPVSKSFLPHHASLLLQSAEIGALVPPPR